MADRRLFVQQTVTRLVNRATRAAHRLIGFGTAPRAEEPFCLASAHDVPLWAELTVELRLRDITRQLSPRR